VSENKENKSYYIAKFHFKNVTSSGHYDLLLHMQPLSQTMYCVYRSTAAFFISLPLLRQEVTQLPAQPQ